MKSGQTMTYLEMTSMTMADPIRDNAGGHYWTPNDFKRAKTDHQDALRERQVGGDHYRQHEIQPWDVIDAYGLSFYEGNVLKYLLRRKQDTDRLTDLQKARHYLEKCIDLEEAKP